jgi:tRNA nucleotidyltransferase/poly(A) polymerase
VTHDYSFDLSPLIGNSIAADLANRDFTINAMAFDLSGQVLLDPLDGRFDLHNRIIKMASAQAFDNDPLRQLRAFRLAVQFHSRIESVTFQALKAGSGVIQTCAGERIRAELFKLLALPGTFEALEQMAACGLLFDLFPELALTQTCMQNEHHSYDVWTHTLAAGRQLEPLIDPGAQDQQKAPIRTAVAHLQRHQQIGLLKMALLLHDVGKPATRRVDPEGRARFHGHGRRGAGMAARICSRLKCSRQESDTITGVIRHHNRPLWLARLHAENRLSDRAVTRLFIHCAELTPAVLLHATADVAGKRPAPDKEAVDCMHFIETLLARYFDSHARRLAAPALLTGRDLITAFGLAPSPLFRKLLDKVETARLAGEISEKQQALDLVAKLLDRPD